MKMIFLLLVSIVIAAPAPGPATAPATEECLWWMSAIEAVLDYEGRMAGDRRISTCMFREKRTFIGTTYGCYDSTGAQQKCERCVPMQFVQDQAYLCKSGERL